MDELGELDISWIEEHEKENKINENCFREPMNEINIVYLFLNKENEINRKLNETMVLNESNTSGDRIITNNKILEIIQNKK